MDVASILARAARLFPERCALVEGGARASYAELAGRAGAAAAFLAARRVAAGDRVALLEHNSRAFLECTFAAAGVGAALVPLNTRSSGGELAAALAASGARWLFARADFAELVATAYAGGGHSLEGVVWFGGVPPSSSAIDARAYEDLTRDPRPYAPAACAAGDVAQLYFTSGTTGRPKGVMLTHENVCAHAEAAVAELALSAEDRWGHFAPMFHLADAWATLAITSVGGRHVMQARFDAAETLRAIERERVTITNLVPTMLNLMVKDPEAGRRDLSSMRLVLSGGAPIAPDVVRRVIATFGCEYVQTYGMTETSPYLTLGLLAPHLRSLPAEERFRIQCKTGRRFAAVELEVVRDDGHPVEPDGVEVGEIRARGPTVTPGYWRDPEATAAAIRGGWLYTGDLATIDREGYLDIVDRKKDLIITGGEKVYTTEVERVLYEHASVLEAAVVGLPDDVWGEGVAAAIVLRAGAAATEDELRDHCRAALAGYKVPRRVVFLSELPRTGSGKIQKRELRETLARAI